MAIRVYVGNLGIATTDEQLQAMFTRFGKVSFARVTVNGDTGKSKGFGFVEMADTQEAEAAIKGLSGKQLDGRPLVVNRPGPSMATR